MASFSILTAFWIIKTSQAKERSKEKQRGKSSKVKKTEDSSCSLPSYFWSTYQSPFSTFYISFQISGSQESNASNRVRFGAEIRKIWPLEDNCSKFVRNSHSTFRLSEIRTTPLLVRISHQPMLGANSPLFCRFHFRSFLLYFLM